MKPEGWEELRQIFGTVIGLVLFAVFLILILGTCAGCSTYKAVTTAPPEFWETIERILLALLQDLHDIADFLL